jgi:hypothetical protein
MARFYPTKTQYDTITREIDRTRATQHTPDLRRDLAAFAHGRADELDRIMRGVDTPSLARARRAEELANTQGLGRAYIKGEQDAVDYIEALTKH